ncbi:1,3-beta-D-glucan synthase [Dinochytrium kinnereticum]|nr:1,3-beta-D-glucan synthase [Dinochytrium kinnereticum]
MESTSHFVLAAEAIAHSDKFTFPVPKGWTCSSKYGAAGTSSDTLLDFISGTRFSSSGSSVGDEASEAWLSQAASTSELGSTASVSTNIYESILTALNTLLQLSNYEAKTLDEILDLLATRYGFQQGSRDNARDYFLSLLDSRACKDTILTGLRSLHADIICGDNANFKTWYFSVILNIENTSLKDLSFAPSVKDEEEVDNDVSKAMSWKKNNENKSMETLVTDISLYLLIWTECSNLRLMPECVCFLYYVACDYHADGPSPGQQTSVSFLEDITKPLYQFLRDEVWHTVGSKLVLREKDHSHTVGYDDMNEFFWSMDSISKLKLKTSNLTLWSVSPEGRYIALKDVDWRKAFKKAFFERRTIFHAFCNFSRIWILHLTFFWAFMVFVVEPIAFRSHRRSSSRFSSNRLQPRQNRFRSESESKAAELETLYRWAAVSLSGAVASLLGLIASLFECSFLSREVRRSRLLSRRIVYLVLLFFLNCVPGAFVFYFPGRGTLSYLAIALGMVMSALTLGVLLFIPTSRFPFKSRKAFQRSHGAAFTSNFARLKRLEHFTSIGLWALVFASKIIESLVFLIMPLGKPIEILLNVFKKNECKTNAMICLALKYLSVLNLIMLVVVLYFLDTYMWWIVWSTALGVVRALLSGLSALTPWRNVFARLPERMLSKILNTQALETDNLEKTLCAQLWNAIVLCMSLDHLLSLKQLKKLAYWRKTEVATATAPPRVRIKQPRFFLDQEDVTTKNQYVLPGSEAERRVYFFAKSLSMTFPSPTPVAKMPSFSVLTPHFSEKILLSLRDIIKEHDTSSTLTLLEYLKSLYPDEWDNFLFDTKLGAGDFSTLRDVDDKMQVKTTKDIPLSEVGFREHSEAAILRTRIWASLRSQTLFRTVAGFMNYGKAISLLQKIETAKGSQVSDAEHDASLVDRKFTFVLAMQNYTKLDAKQIEDTEILLKIFPTLRIGYLETIEVEGQETEYFSVLIDGVCSKDDDGRRRPIFRIKLPGNPFLGDGKADNQNLNLIWTRGEFIQLIDANQDNYFEETVKIRSFLAEFDEPEEGAPVAIVGAREHIFSEGVGVLGDVAAGKEYSFGTIVQRVTAKLGGRLHYGHPDFLNAVFMNTRGGVSKAQKGLCVNEDIFAGMNAVFRGGRIKHTEYLQCGKGRDLGVLSISKFNAKIGDEFAFG